ncbi:dTDP-4-dehydrorhamnose 3,5-epimerase family protein [Priestia sp. YIM B13489]|uniref:dTDP-4-dehydrorhamnose 3,5-epimerase family protein n=1 Tax=Priestia sp. YIM B13489 TaxID=3366313 RepID=UPI00366DAA4B
MRIEGVKSKKLIKHCDDRGFFAEVLRDDDDLLSNFGQISWSTSFPGVIKAFHYHQKQDDIWFFPSGNVQVVLHDLRENSSTKGQTEIYYMGEDNPIILLIPKGVAHGYRVLGEKSATVIYCTTKSYDPTNPDEKRISWNDPEIGFDWNTKFK